VCFWNDEKYKDGVLIDVERIKRFVNEKRAKMPPYSNKRRNGDPMEM